MIVRNWMRREPFTVTSDTLVADANRILAEQNLRALPVVDDGRLRGLITRKMCLRAAAHAMRSQDGFELQYFTGRLKVKDLMVRFPKTIDAGDTMQNCLRRGQEEGVSQFPVLENDRVVGLISATEITSLAAHVLGVWDARHAITLAPLAIAGDTLARIAQTAERAGAICESIISVGEVKSPRRIVIHFSGADPEVVGRALTGVGCRILEIDRDRTGAANSAAEAGPSSGSTS